MQVYSVFTRESIPGCTFSYRRMGTKTVLLPDLEPEELEKESYLPAESLLSRRKKKVSFSRVAVLGSGVDLCVRFPKRVFVDHVTFDADCAGLGRVEILSGTAEDRRLLAVGKLHTAVNAMCEELIVRVHSVNAVMTFTGIRLEVADVENAVYPTPCFARFDGGASPELASLSVKAETEDERFAGEILRGEIERKIGKNHKISEEKGKIQFKTVRKIEVPDGRSFEGSEAFSVTVTERSITLCGTDRKALIYAVHTLMQLVKDGTVPCGTVADKPYLEMRGMHLGLPTHDNFAFCKSFLSDFMVPLRYNTLFVEVSAAIALDSHPEIAESWAEECEKYRQGKRPMPHHYDMRGNGEILTKEEVRELIAYAEAYGIEIIPEIQSFGHAQYLTVPHPEIAERDTVAAKVEVEGGAEEMAAQVDPFCYCPSNELSYKLLFEVADEIIELFRPKRYVSMGHDEVYQIGLCEKCRTKDPAELYVSDVLRLHEYLAGKGLKMAIWADMLQDCTKYLTFPAIDRIPKDILLLDFIWYFNLKTDTEDRLLRHGFSVMLGNLYSSHFPRYETRAAKRGIVGGQLSTWCEISIPCHTRTGKMFDTAYTAQMMWSGEYRSELRDLYTYLIRTMIYPEAKDKMYRTRGIGETFAPPADKPIPLCGAEYNRTLDRQCVCVSGEQTDDLLPSRRTVVKPDCRVKKLSFTHGTFGEGLMLNDVLWSTHTGKYIVHYEDGATAEIELRFGEQIYSCGKWAQPLADAYYRHVGYRDQFLCEPAVGKTPEGTDYTLYTLTWVNPRPEEKIVSVELCAETERSTVLALFAAYGE